MKKNVRLWFGFLILLLFVCAFFFIALNSEPKHSNLNQSQFTGSKSKQQTAIHVQPEQSNTPKNTYQSNVQRKVSKPNLTFLDKINSLLSGETARLNKINRLLKLLHLAQNDQEKISVLQSLAALRAIEVVDDLIVIANATHESNAVRAAAISALNEAYLVEDKLVDKVGSATVYSQSEKISKYMEALVNNKDTPNTLRDQALFGYSYTNVDKAKTLAETLIDQAGKNGVKPTAAESGLISSVLFFDETRLKQMLPKLSNNPQVLTDDIVMHIGTLASDEIMLKTLDKSAKDQLVTLLKNYKLNPSSPDYVIKKEVLLANQIAIANSGTAINQ